MLIEIHTHTHTHTAWLSECILKSCIKRGRWRKYYLGDEKESILAL